MRNVYLLVFLLASLTMQGQNIEKLQKKVASGDTKAMIELAFHYEDGYGVTADSARALELYRQAERLGDKDALGHLSRYSLFYSALGHDSVECYRQAQASADSGSSYGIYRLAVCYLDGIGVQRDRHRAHQLIDQAMTKGCVEAYCLAGHSYIYGCNGYPHDIEQGAKLMRKVPDNFRFGDKSELLAIYSSMHNDVKGAVKILERGVALGQLDARMEYARYRFWGIGMPEDEHTAIKEIQQIQAQVPGYFVALMMEADMRVNAKDTTLRDRHRILSLYEQAASTRFPLGYCRIGDSYIFGTFTPVDTTMALIYWRLGVRNRDANSMMRMAQYYQMKDNIDSVRYYALMAYDLELCEAAGLLAQITYDENPEHALAYGLQAADWGDESYRMTTGDIYAYQGDTSRALECYDRAIHNAYYDAYLGKAAIAESRQGMKASLKLLEEGGKKGSTRCNFALGRYYEEEEDYKKAAHYYEQSGEAKADFRLASMLLNNQYGSGNDDDKARAVALLRRAAQAGDRDGMYWLGFTFQQGELVERNLDSALYWFNILAENGDGKALMQMAIAYEHGRGVKADTALAMDYYRRAGEAGYSDGYAYLGDFYRTGTSTVNIDSAKAFEYYQMAAAINEDNAAGLYYVGDSYLHGIGVMKDTVAALPYFQAAAAKGSYTSMSVIGNYYNYGWGGVQRNGDTALYYYYEASKGNDPTGEYMIGQWLYDRGNSEKALGFLASASNHGNIDARVTYAHALLNGNGIQADPTTAAKILNNVASVDRGGRAYMMLSIMYLNGVGVPIDTAAAISCMDTSILFGNSLAMRYMGDLYANGIGMPRDTVAAVQWYERSAKAGNISSMLKLATCYKNGELAPKNPKRAAELLQQATDRGNLEAQCRLGLCYEEGEGVILNSRKAYNLYLDAAERGSAYGMYLTGMCYIDGIYVQEDKEQAARWFLKGAEAGNITCCYIVGQMYADGDGLKKNKKEAKRWLIIAAENGLEPAKQRLSEL
ncbi:MAG: SEL1-like repeat protein [Bacteroidales bacterium]|nr:SEL1-like repeat protein [Bacteroidales bacterium]